MANKIENGFNAYDVPGSGFVDIYNTTVDTSNPALGSVGGSAATGSQSGGILGGNMATNYSNYTLEDLYRTKLGRTNIGDEARAHYTEKLASGISPAQIAAELAASEEGQAYAKAAEGKMINPITGAIIQGTPEEYEQLNAFVAANPAGTAPVARDTTSGDGGTGTGTETGFDIQNMISDQLSGAADTISGLQSFQMPNINALQAEAAMANAIGYNPATIAGTDLSQYMNPYTQEVIDRSLSDIERARMAQANNLGFAATKAGAFGGSRHGVAEALSNEAYAKQAADTAAGLRQQAYNQALTSAGQDVGYQNVASQFTSGAANQANLANAAAQNAMNQFNVNQNMAAQTANQNAALSSAGVQLNAANSGANLANLGFGMQNTVNTNLFNQGLAQQQLNQQLLNNAMTQYTNYVNSPVGALQTLQAGMPGSAPTSTTTSSTPGLFDIFLGGGKTGSALGWW